MKALLWMLTLVGDLLLFLASYIPLLLMIAALNMEHDWLLGLCLAMFALALGLFLLIALHVVKGFSGEKVEVASVEDDGHASMAYVATYILPFISGIPGTIGGAAASVVYVVTLFLIFRATEVKSVNPSLYLLRYRISRITTSSKKGTVSVYVIHRGAVHRNSVLNLVNFGGAKVAKIVST